VNSVKGSVVTTRGSMGTKSLVGSLQIPFRFQLTCWETEFWGRNLIVGKVRSKDYYDKGPEVMKNKMRDKVILYEERVWRGKSRNLNSQ
jgi:hypothetical protein